MLARPNGRRAIDRRPQRIDDVRRLENRSPEAALPDGEHADLTKRRRRHIELNARGCACGQPHGKRNTVPADHRFDLGWYERRPGDDDPHAHSGAAPRLPVRDLRSFRQR